MNGESVDQKPSVGRIVHYVSYGTPGGEYASACRGAMVSEVLAPPGDAPWAEPVSLVVFSPEGLFFNQRCVHDEARLDDGGRVGAGGTWHWPERV